MATSTEPTVLNKEEEEEDVSRPSAEDEDTGAQVAPIVKLQEVAVETGEENEDVLIDLKAKLYRFDTQQWKERGVGTVKLLKHKESGKVRLVMRQNKTLKICANHLVLPTLTLQEHQGNEKSCVWHAADFSDGELKEETFCIRFPSIENCRSFKDKVEEITESLANDNGKNEEATAAADLIEKLTVGGNDQDEKPQSKDVASSGEKNDDAKGEPVPKGEK